MSKSTPASKASPASYASALAKLRPMLDAADRTGAGGYWVVGLAAKECRDRGATLKEIAQAMGRSVPSVSKMLQAVAQFAQEPKSADECRRFMLVWSNGARAADRAGGGKRSGSTLTAAQRALERLRQSINGCNAAGVPASDIIPVIRGVYGATAATAAVAA